MVFDFLGGAGILTFFDYYLYDNFLLYNKPVPALNYHLCAVDLRWANPGVREDIHWCSRRSESLSGTAITTTLAGFPFQKTGLAIAA